MAVIVAARMRVMLGDRDISRMVRSVSIDAEVGSVVMTRLELMCGVELRDGVVHLDGPAMAGGTLETETENGDRVAIRAITFGDIR